MKARPGERPLLTLAVKHSFIEPSFIYLFLIDSLVGQRLVFAVGRVETG